MLKLLIKAIATWRISHLLVYEDGPSDSIITFRHMMNVHHPKVSPLFCFKCTSIWAGLILSLLPKAFSVPLALSGLAIAVEWFDEWLELQSER